MKIKDRIEYKSKPRPLMADETTTVHEAVERMAERRFGSIVVTGEDGRMSGLFTERDAMMRVIKEGRDPKTTKLSEVMTRDIRTARPDDQVVDWLRNMSNDRFRRLPVVDDNGQVVAIMTQGDFVSYTWPDLLSQANNQLNDAVPKNFPVYLIVFGVLVYSLVLVWFLD